MHCLIETESSEDYISRRWKVKEKALPDRD